MPNFNLTRVPRGQPIPPKVWLAAVETMREYARMGNEWVEKGKSRDGELYERFCESETEYNARCDQIWFGKWEDWQGREWEDIITRFD